MPKKSKLVFSELLNDPGSRANICDYGHFHLLKEHADTCIFRSTRLTDLRVQAVFDKAVKELLDEFGYVADRNAEDNLHQM